MKLTLYSEGRIIHMIEGIKSPVVEDSGIYWEGGSVTDTGSFLLLDDDVEVGEVITEDLVKLNQCEKYRKIPPLDEMLELKMQLAQTNALLLDFLESSI